LDDADEDADDADDVDDADDGYMYVTAPFWIFAYIYN
jgi:hypothetical protein